MIPAIGWVLTLGYVAGVAIANLINTHEPRPKPRLVHQHDAAWPNDEAACGSLDERLAIISDRLRRPPCPPA